MDIGLDIVPEIRSYLMDKGWVVPDQVTFRGRLEAWRRYREENGPHDMTVLHPDFEKGAAQWGLGIPTEKKKDSMGEVAIRGITLRDYFAGQAIPVCFDGSRPYFDIEICSDNAYKIADGMIKAREK